MAGVVELSVEAGGLHVGARFVVDGEAWSKFKTWLRKRRARVAEAFKSAVEEGLDRITPRDVLGWTKHAGYRTLEVAQHE